MGVTAGADGQPRDETFQNDSLFAGMNVHHEYDELLRGSTLAVGPTGGDPLLVQTVGYDEASRYKSFTQGAFSAVYNYEPNSPLVASVAFQNGATMTTTKAYDHLNRLKFIGSSVGSEVVSSHAYTYDDANERLRATLADGSAWFYSYDDLGQLNAASRKWSDGAPAQGQQFAYAFDTMGNRASTTTNGRTAQYTSNRLNQCVSREVPAGLVVVGGAASTATVTVNGTPTSRHSSYFAGTVTVDNSAGPVNQLVTVTGVKAGAGLNGANVVITSTGSMYVAQTPESFTHDDDGNLIADGRWTYTWDAENRLVKMTGGALEIAFGYDALNRRVRKTVKTGGAVTSDTGFLYEGWNVVAELNMAATNGPALAASNLWGVDLGGGRQTAGGIGGLLARTTNGATYSYTYDGNGNVSDLVDASGAVAARYEYGPFGEPIRESGPMAGSNPYRFSTKYTDSETGLLYFGYRYYKASTGRWLSMDPLMELSGLNLYAYVRNRVPCQIDPFGLCDGFPTANEMMSNMTSEQLSHTSQESYDTYSYGKILQDEQALVALAASGLAVGMLTGVVVAPEVYVMALANPEKLAGAIMAGNQIGQKLGPLALAWRGIQWAWTGNQPTR